MKLLSTATLLTIGTFSAVNTHAESFDPAPVKLTDGFSVTPLLEADVYYNDNIYTDDTDPTASSIYVLAPSLSFGVDDGINRFGGLYKLSSGTYEVDSDDNYLDHDFSLFGHNEFTDRHRTDVQFKYSRLHEARGSGLNELGQRAPSPVLYDTLLAKFYYQYGASTALVNVGAGLKYNFKEYKNFIEATRYDNYDTWTALADMDYQVGAVSYLTLDLSYADIAYDYLESGEASKDNSDTRFEVGGRWEGLGKTTGTAKVGYQYKTFEDNTRENFHGGIIDIGILWEPLTYSKFEWHLGTGAEDSDTVGDYILASSTSLSWGHDWTEHFDSNVTLLYTKEDYVGDNQNREDETANAGVSLSYEFTRWLKMKAGYEFSKKGSNVSNIRYDQNAFNLGLAVSL